VTKNDLFDIGLVELGLDYDIFLDMTPKAFVIEQMKHNRKQERNWEKTREILAMIYNTAPGKKINKSGRQIIPLEIDKKTTKVEWDDDFARKIINAWN
jgi:hypothetical protein